MAYPQYCILPHRIHRVPGVCPPAVVFGADTVPQKYHDIRSALERLALGEAFEPSLAEAFVDGVEDGDAIMIFFGDPESNGLK